MKQITDVFAYGPDQQGGYQVDVWSRDPATNKLQRRRRQITSKVWMRFRQTLRVISYGWYQPKVSKHFDTCPACDGTRIMDGLPDNLCPICGGTGWVRVKTRVYGNRKAVVNAPQES